MVLHKLISVPLNAELLCLKMAAHYEVFAHPVLYQRYRATPNSNASGFVISCLLATVILPVVILYNTGGFWIIETTYQETPLVAFKYDYFLVLDLGGTTKLEYVTFSSFEKYNDIHWRKCRSPVVKSLEKDEDGDGRPDQLKLNFVLQILDNENVMGITLILFFNYRLVKYSSLHMESLAVVRSTSPLPAEKIFISGDLSIKQKQPLTDSGIDTRYNVSMIDRTNKDASQYDLQTLLRKYNERNVITTLVEPDIVWKTYRSPGFPFEITANIMYPREETYRYTPSLWYTIKWAWMQYLPVLIIFVYVSWHIKVYVFRNLLVPTTTDESSYYDKRRIHTEV